jgi:hypothetical protein
MALTPDEAVKLAVDAKDLFDVIEKALRKDKDGNVRITPAETRRIVVGLTKLAADFAREYMD